MQNTENQPIWNPSTVTGLSFILTPAFGAYLQASNWKALGQPERAASSKVWFYISLLVLAGLAGLSVYAGGDETSRGLVNVVALIYFAVWYAVSGRLQVAHVKQVYGKTFQKRSLFKPVMIALALVIVYAGIIVGLLIATHGAAAGDDQAVGQRPATGSSGGSSFSLAGLFGGQKLDCAADNVKQTVIEAYGKQLVESGIPDLVWAVRDNRIKVHVDAIHETARNDNSKNIDCAANFAIDFPKDDIERSVRAQQHVVVMQASTSLTDPTFIAPITYQVATPSDAEERKQGRIVTLTTKEDAAVDNLLKTYMADYQVLAYATPDITPTSTNSTPWEKAFKDATIQACSKSAGVDRCTCQLSGMEKVVSEQQMARIGYALQNAGMLAGDRFPNFKKLADALGQQCPLTQNLAAILGDGGTAAADSSQQASAVPTGEATQQTAAQPQQQPTQPDVVASPMPESTQPSHSAIVASFDCARASSKVEKLICSTPDTADADRRLAATYRTAAAKFSDQAGLKQQQRDWLKERNACDSADCLLRVTEARIQALSAM